MDLKSKTLLLMGGGAYANGIKKYKDEKSFRIIAVGKDKDTPISKISDSFYNVDTQNVEEICSIVRKEKVDGIFVGSSEVNISPAIDVAEKTGVFFYVTREQWDIISNKAQFKKIAREYGFPVIPEYKLSQLPTNKEIDSLVFPVMIKPTDSSGARGMNPCYRKEDFIPLFNEALRWSKKKEVIVEDLIVGADEVFVNYTIQDGNSCLSYSFTKFQVNCPGSKAMVPLFHMYPSHFIDEYYSKVDESAKRMIKGLGLNNGTLTLQGFYKDGNFFFFEAGFRMGGAQAYILTDYMWKANSLEYMINYALTGSMADYMVTERENARFKFPCCNYYIALNPGIVDYVEGLEDIKKFDFVLNVTEMVKPGDCIVDTNALERIGYRVHVIGEDKEELAKNLVNISRTIRIISTTGEEMQMEPLTYERCIDVINSK